LEVFKGERRVIKRENTRGGEEGDENEEGSPSRHDSPSEFRKRKRKIDTLGALSSPVTDRRAAKKAKEERKPN